MINNEMHLEKQSYLSSSANNLSFMIEEKENSYNEKQPLNYNKVYNSLESSAKKEKFTNIIFSFLQKFRTRHNFFSENMTSLPSSPQARLACGTSCRWESVESVLSSATAASFAFIPSHQLHSISKADYNATQSSFSLEQNSQELVRKEKDSKIYTVDSSSIFHTNSSYLRKKYNLLGSNGTLCQSKEELKKNNTLKKLQRNSTGNVENLKATNCNDQDFLISLQHSRGPTKDKIIRTSTTEFPSKNSKKVFCHRPGKRKAPLPPERNNLLINSILKNLDPDRPPNAKIAHSHRKKYKAPSPPKNIIMEFAEDENEQQQHIEKKNETIYNDSLKLEKGLLKANKTLIETPSPSNTPRSTTPTNISNCVPVSPKPWYKRSTIRHNDCKEKSSGKSLNKMRTCEKLLDERMVESRLQKSSSFHDNRQFKYSSQLDNNGKRKSQISMLANISELDREAAEIIRERKITDYYNNKFHTSSRKRNCQLVGLTDNLKSIEKEKEISKRNTGGTKKDLISILNTVTTSKIPVGLHNKPTLTSKEHANNFTIMSQVITSEQSVKNCHFHNKISSIRPVEKKTENKLTITEINDFNKQNLRTDINNKKNDEREQKSIESEQKFFISTNKNISNIDSKIFAKPGTPIKPFSNWTCPQCTLENPSWKFICEACKQWRPYYSVNKSYSDTDKVTPAIMPEDLKLETAYVRPISKNFNEIPKNIQKQVHEVLMIPSSTPSIDEEKNQLEFDNLNNDDGSKSKKKDIFDVRENNLMKHKNGDSKSVEENLKFDLNADDNIEEIRKSRVAYFTKNHTNNLNINYQDDKDKIHIRINKLPMNIEKEKSEKKNKYYYNEQERKQLTKILKELKDSNTSFDNESKKQKQISIGLSLNSEIKPETFAGKVVNKLNLKFKDRPINFENNNLKKNTTGKTISVLKSTAANENDVIKTPVTNRENENDFQPSFNQEKEINNSKMIPCGNIPLNQETSINLGKLKSKSINEISKPDTCLKNPINFTEIDELSKQLSQLKYFSDRPTIIKQSNMNVKNIKGITNFGVNRLLQKLQTSIATGQHHEAAKFARELARLKVNCLMSRQEEPDDEFPSTSRQSSAIRVYMYVNNHKLGDRGPISVKVNPAMTVTELKTKICQEFGIPVLNQLWMFGKQFVVDESITLNQIGVNIPGASITLCYLEIKSMTPGNIEQENNQIADVEINEGMTFNELNELSEWEVASNADLEDNIVGWPCTVCTLINELTEPKCLACENDRPEEYTRDNYNTTQQEILEQKFANYEELEKNSIILNTEKFECLICLVEYLPGEGVVLKDCLHIFCKECLNQAIASSTEAEVKCPYIDDNYSCESIIQEREIKALVSSKVYEQHLARSVSIAQNKIKNSFYCKTVNCQGWCIYEDDVNQFHCPICDKINCLTCQTIHAGLNCREYQRMIQLEPDTNPAASKTRRMLEKMLKKGDAMTCPTCEVILMKKSGCDWLVCSMCKTEICWVTRGARWGVKGKGDTTGGCKCLVNGVKCHPGCGNCH